MMALSVGTFVWLTWLTHARFGSFGFDLETHPLGQRARQPPSGLNCGINGSGPSVVLEAVPTLARNIWRNVTDGKGAT
jgi:hypothetical protein